MKRKLILLSFIAIAMSWSCKHEILQDPGNTTPVDPITGNPTSSEVCFESDVLPIFQSYCAKSGCHDAGTRAEGYVLNSYDNIIRRGITAGNATNSTLYKVLYASGENKMPRKGSTSLTDAQKNIIGVWINQGAMNTKNCSNSCDVNSFAYTANIKPIMSTYCIGCHSPTNASKGIDLTTYNGVKTVAAAGNFYGAITHSTGFTAMPQNAAKLSDCQINVIQKWIAAGLPNN